jgi:cell division protein FtsQ
LRRTVGTLGLGILVAGMAVVFVLVHDIATQCRSLAVRRIAVVGNRHLDEMTVMRQAGIHPGINILAVRLGPCRTRLLAHPWIAQAAVRRRLPDRIEIRVVEHRPLALVEMPDGRFLIDTDGRPFKRWSDGDPVQMPLIRGLAYVDLPALEPPETPMLGAALDALRYWQKSIDSSEPGQGAPVLVVDRDAGVSIETGSTLGTVVLGQGDYRQKFANLSRLVEKVAPQGAAGWQRIDLTHLQRIVVWPSGGHKEV